MNKREQSRWFGSLTLFALGICLAISETLHADEKSDDITAALNQARAMHQDAVAAAELSFLTAVDAEMKSVAAKGDLDLTKALLAEREAFEKRSGPVTQPGLLAEIRRYLTQLKSADNALARTYGNAVADYTRQLKLDLASAIQSEQKQFEAWRGTASGDGGGILKHAVLLWTFDVSDTRTIEGTTIVSDLSGRGNDGRIIGHREIPRPPGKAVAFDKRGTSLLSDKDIGITEKQPRTFALWIYIGMPPGTRMDNMFGWGTSRPSQQFRWGFWKNRYRLWTYGDATTRSLFDAARGWHHVTMTYDGTILRAYRNGSPDDAVAYTLNLNTQDSRLTLNENFVGAIDEVAILARALSPLEVKELYDRSRRGLGVNTGPRTTRTRSIAYRRSLWPSPANEPETP